MRETKPQRDARYRLARKMFVEALRKAGNDVREEYRFDFTGKRKWRFDIAILSQLPSVAIEIEGFNGAHQRMRGFREDLEKYGEAFAQGFVVLRVSWDQICDGTAMDWLERAGVRTK